MQPRPEQGFLHECRLWPVLSDARKAPFLENRPIHKTGLFKATFKGISAVMSEDGKKRLYPGPSQFVRITHDASGCKHAGQSLSRLPLPCGSSMKPVLKIFKT